MGGKGPVVSGAIAKILPNGRRLHLQHGPIDLIIDAEGQDRAAAYHAAIERFNTVLEEIVQELPLMRLPVNPSNIQSPYGTVTRRMHAAVMQHAQSVFVTPMAAVAGAVADEILSRMVAAVCLERCYVNNGGDIALHLENDAVYSAAMVGLDGSDRGRIALRADQGVGGIATSGLGGRSLTMGIADQVTVLADCAATADVAATLIANAVDLPGHPSVRRTPATVLEPDSDLGERMVVETCGPLTQNDIETALGNGAAAARGMLAEGLIKSAALFLRGSHRVIENQSIIATSTDRIQEHA